MKTFKEFTRDYKAEYKNKRKRINFLKNIEPYGVRYLVK